MYITTAAAATVLDVDIKSIDNLLSRDGKHLVTGGKQGRRRRIDASALEPVAIAKVLNRELGVPLARGLEVAEQLLKAPSFTVAVGRLGNLSFDVIALKSHLGALLTEVLEQTALPKRGRPSCAQP